MSLSRLPKEVIHHFSFLLLAQDPLGPPKALLTLALTCRAFHFVVSSHSFRAKLCRLMFDVGPVTRRLFHPRDSDLADELHRCCNLLNEIRICRADVDENVKGSVDDTLVSAYLLMLNNDGKNYAQLEHAGLDAYVDKFVKARLWDGTETNQGWPLDSFNNSTALWLMWMTLTKQKLLAESAVDREDFYIKILPYVVLPHRYASASAPPNHFNLPLDPQNPCHQQRLISIASPETPYPIYLDDSSINIPYFNARIPICSPLITIAAKLLFVARKELFPIRAPPHLPQAPGPGIVGATQEDYRELNRSPAARLCRVVTWNWDTGCPNRVGGEDADGYEIEEGWEESKNWDTEWWRRLLCRDCNAQRPKYLPGDVFKLGSMGGGWHGKEYLPHGTLFVRFLQQPDVHYPGIPNQRDPQVFTESSIGLTVEAIFLDIQEHHKICECPQESSNVSESHPYVAPTLSFARAGVGVPSLSSSLPIMPQSGRCGVVPIPAPVVYRSIANEQEAGQNEGAQEMGEPQVSDAIDRSFQTPRINVIDNSMSNAWFPGHFDSVSFAKVPNTTTRGAMRDKMICALNFQAPDFRSVWNRPEESECLTLGGRRRQEGQGKMDAYVYETYDRDKTSMHRGLEMGDSISGAGANNIFTSTSTSSSNDYTNDPHKCQRCLQREELIRLERKKAEHRSKMILDRGLRSYGSGGGYDWSQDDEYDEEDMDETEDEEMRDVDVDELSIDVDGIIAETTSEGSTTSMQTDDDSSSQFISFGDDDREAYLDIEDRKRSCYDKCRIGVECSGVGDILLSGETGARHAVWKQYRMYGRVRPWDGLIGILRTSGSAAEGTLSNFFIFGYIVGESNFVGEMRLAATDPLSPTWGGAFAMSRRVDGRGRGQA